MSRIDSVGSILSGIFPLFSGTMEAVGLSSSPPMQFHPKRAHEERHWFATLRKPEYDGFPKARHIVAVAGFSCSKVPAGLPMTFQQGWRRGVIGHSLGKAVARIAMQPLTKCRDAPCIYMCILLSSRREVRTDRGRGFGFGEQHRLLC